MYQFIEDDSNVCSFAQLGNNYCTAAPVPSFSSHILPIFLMEASLASIACSTAYWNMVLMFALLLLVVRELLL